MLLQGVSVIITEVDLKLKTMCDVTGQLAPLNYTSLISCNYLSSSDIRRVFFKINKLVFGYALLRVRFKALKFIRRN